jgi:hypothetical protein
MKRENANIGAIDLYWNCDTNAKLLSFEKVAKKTKVWVAVILYQ